MHGPGADGRVPEARQGGFGGGFCGGGGGGRLVHDLGVSLWTEGGSEGCESGAERRAREGLV